MTIIYPLHPVYMLLLNLTGYLISAMSIVYNTQNQVMDFAQWECNLYLFKPALLIIALNIFHRFFFHCD